MTMLPRCPECDVEMDEAPDGFKCVICGGAETESYFTPETRSVTRIPLLETLRECTDLLVRATDESPELKDLLGNVYRDMQEIGERLSDKE